MAEIKEKTIQIAQINSENVSAYVSWAYDSLRETLEALCLQKGYKVLSHICIGKLLQTLFSDFNYKEFDRLRYIRNRINYYGQKIEYEQGKAIIHKTFTLRKETLQHFKKK